MPSVKQPIFAATLILTTAGCTELELARFAPPGLIKYEDLAGDQPVNPAIQDRIDNRKVDDHAEYPDLSRTPDEDDRPAPRPTSERIEQTEELVAMRDALQSATDADRVAADAEKTSAALLPEQRDALNEQAEGDAASVERERNN